MKDKFVRVAAGTPAIRTADCMGNAAAVISCKKQAGEKKAKLLVMPEMCITGYTAADLLFHSVLLDGAEKALSAIKEFDILTEGGIIICERPADKQLDLEISGLQRCKDYRYGKTWITVFRKETDSL